MKDKGDTHRLYGREIYFRFLPGVEPQSAVTVSRNAAAPIWKENTCLRYAPILCLSYPLLLIREVLNKFALQGIRINYPCFNAVQTVGNVFQCLLKRISAEAPLSRHAAINLIRDELEAADLSRGMTQRSNSISPL